MHKISRIDKKEEETQNVLRRINALSTSISHVFTNIYGHHIDVCIKIITIEKERALAITLARDNKSATKDRKTGMSDKGNHWLDLNSDFNFIYSNFDDEGEDTSFYHQTQLPLKKDYQNTRLKNGLLKVSFGG